MSAKVDLNAYSRRLGLADFGPPTLETLRTVQQRHMAAIPFEAMDVLLGRPVPLDPEAVDSKLLGGGRGGYCFEQNGLFHRVLLALGFAVEPLIARVLWQAPQGARPPRTHMALKVALDGEAWLADVAFGGIGPTEPLRLDSEGEQATRFETYRIGRGGDGWILEAKLEGGWQPLYELAAEPPAAADYEVANWFTSTHASSPFRSNLIVARTDGERRFALLNERLTIRSAGGGAEQRDLSAAELAQTLEETFGLRVDAAWRPLLARIASGDAAS